jgi:hypothetical protein
MRDRREELLTRLVDVALGVMNVRRVYRNVESSPELMRPSIVIRDGEEEASQADVRNHHAFALANVVTITPEIYLIAAGNEDTMPAMLASMRMALIRDIIHDTTLQSICGTNGSIRYGGASLKDDYGSMLQGEMRLTFEIAYPLLEADFT